MFLKMRLGIGAAMLGLGACFAAAILFFGMTRIAGHLETALAAETRMARYSVLSTQVSTFLVIATEAVQTGLPRSERSERLKPVADNIIGTFALLNSDLERAVATVQISRLDARSRLGTQSLGLARMQALFQNTLIGLDTDTIDRARLRAQIDTFAAAFDPLLNHAVNTERRLRNDILSGIEQLRSTLTWAAIGIALLAILMVLAFYLLLIRPQFIRLDRLHAAAEQIRDADFAVDLPTTRGDEIGQLYEATNQMAAALSDRQAAVQAEWERLNDTIALRTKELRTANEALSEIDENRRKFFADVSHELRTPLTVILMEAQLGAQGATQPAAALATIRGRAARMSQRIDDLLRVARSESGQLALDYRVADLAAITAEAIEETRSEIDNAGMQLRAEALPASRVLCDPNWMRQVIVGLIRNAIRHARSGGRIHVRPAGDARCPGIAIIDNGPGIEKADQAGVFDRFVQGGDGRAQGFGLGLALTRWVIETQNGEIALISPVPREQALGSAPGTKIAVRLPASGC